MYAPSYRLASFDVLPERVKFEVLGLLLDALILANVRYLQVRPQTPNLYESGVRYLTEPDNVDEWQDIPDTLARMHGDCEDLASWRVAELKVRGGEPTATHAISVDLLPNASGRLVTTFHICVMRANGKIEDPSRRLGMP